MVVISVAILVASGRTDIHRHHRLTDLDIPRFLFTVHLDLRFLITMQRWTRRKRSSWSPMIKMVPPVRVVDGGVVDVDVVGEEAEGEEGGSDVVEVDAVDMVIVDEVTDTVVITDLTMDHTMDHIMDRIMVNTVTLRLPLRRRMISSRF